MMVIIFQIWQVSVRSTNSVLFVLADIILPCASVSSDDILLRGVCIHDDEEIRRCHQKLPECSIVRVTSREDVPDQVIPV